LRLRLKPVLLTLLGLVVLGVGCGLYWAWVVTSTFAARGWDVPAEVYAAPLALYRGRPLSEDELTNELTRLGYSKTDTVRTPGTYTLHGAQAMLETRAFAGADGAQPARRLDVSFANGKIAAVSDGDGKALAIAELDPLLIGSIFPSHGEDRLVLAPDRIPPLLPATLKVVEDRSFDDNIGIDFRAILRAAFVDLIHGHLEQGGSTLTQQLVRSYFLSTKRTWWRKVREAFMAVALQMHESKQALMDAYINEVYLAQDGARAVHGFGLASMFYFGKPAQELDVPELALLVAQVRGPSYYDPRRHPARALQRRNLVLSQMHEFGLISDSSYAAAVKADLGVLPGASHRASYYAAFLDLLRHRLRRDYAESDLRKKGLRVFSTLDPAVQSAAQGALVDELDELQPGKPPLEGAVVVTDPHNGEIRALVGGRRVGYDGFDRALDAARPVGSLLKPVVYLAALEHQHTLADVIADKPIDVPLDNGATWTPANFDKQAHGAVTAVRALAESLNMATVRLGLSVGVDKVAELLTRLGLDRRVDAYPSLLLGAIDLTPLQVAQIYNTLANGGFRVPLRAVRAVVDKQGNTVHRYPLKLAQAAPAADVYALNQALVQVIRRGTGKTLQARLPDGLTAAGKTGTSDGFRDSWFAGFTKRNLVVSWVGNDKNEPVGLTGATGAGRVWSRVVSSLPADSFDPPVPPGVTNAWIDYRTGLLTAADCPDAVRLAMPPGDLPARAAACGSERVRFVSKLRRWLHKALH
jgi:penicillin-binding protein 1B